MRSPRGRIAGALLALACALRAVQAGQLPVRVYTTDDGLAHDAVNRIVQDSRGFLWFCTDSGLSRFDGDRFANFSAEDGLPSERVMDLLEAADGAYWIATDSGLARLDPAETESAEGRDRGRTFTPVPLDLGRDSRGFLCLYEDGTGGLWVGAVGGLYRIERRQGGYAARAVDLREPARVLPFIQVNAIAPAPAGGLLIATRYGGLYRRGASGRIERERGLRDSEQNVRAIAADEDGSLWLATRAGLVHLGEGGRPAAPMVRLPAPTPEDLPSRWVSDVLRASDGTLYLATKNGLAVVSRERGRRHLRRYGPDEGLAERDLTDLLEDRDGNIWIASSRGVMRLAAGGFEAYRLPKRSGASAARAFLETRAGDLLVAESTEREGMFLHRFTGDGFEPFRLPLPPVYLGWGWNQLVVQSRDGSWWIPTGEGLFHFPPTDSLAELSRARPLAVYRSGDGLGSDEIFRLFEDSRGDLWICAGGLVRLDRATGRLVRHSQDEGAPRTWVFAFAEDRSGAVWMGNEEGLFRYSGGRFTRITAADGLPPGAVRALVVDPEGRLWMGTDGGGVARLEETARGVPRVDRYDRARGLTSDAVRALVADHAGRLYIGTDRGVDFLDPRTGHVAHYSRSEGLASNELDIARVDRAGHVWFGGNAGVSRLRPKPLRPTAPPRVFISGLRFAGVPYVLSPLGRENVADVRLAPSQRQVEIEFVSPGYAGPRAVRFQYRLDGGGGRDWSAPSATRSVQYASLSSGRYRFEVRAVDADGRVSPTPAGVEFTIPSPVWARWWSLTLMGMVGIGAAYGVYRYRLGRLLALERVRSRIASDLHDDVGASLSRIAILSEVALAQGARDTGPVADLLRRIAAAAREAVENMADIVWATDPKRDRAGNLVSRMRAFAGELLAARGIEFRFQAPPDGLDAAIGPDQRREVLLIFKECVNNAVRHARCTRVDVDVRIEGSRLLLEVTDDGSGLEPDTGSEAHGLGSMRRRAARLNGRCDIQSAASGGTTVRLDVPIG